MIEIISVIIKFNALALNYPRQNTQDH